MDTTNAGFFMSPFLVAKWEVFKKVHEVSKRLGTGPELREFFEWVEQQRKEETADEKN